MAKRGPKGPSKYTPEFIDALADQFIEWINTTYEQCQNVTVYRDSKGKVERTEKPMFWLSDFALQRRWAPQMLSQFAAKSEKFNLALKYGHEMQARDLAQGAARGHYAQAITIFTLKNVAKWRDTHALTGADGGDIRIQQNIREDLKLDDLIDGLPNPLEKIQAEEKDKPKLEEMH